MIPGVTPNGLAEELEMIKHPVVFGHWSYPFSIIVFPVVVVILVAIVSYQVLVFVHICLIFAGKQMRFRRRMSKRTNKGHEEQVKKTKGIACNGIGIRLASTISPE